MDAMQGQAMALERQRRNEIELGQIATALRRIDDDEYGYCEACGEDIALARLQSNPTALFCIQCARKNERR